MTALSPLGSIVAQLRGIAALPMSPFSHLLFALICLQFWMSDASAKGTNKRVPPVVTDFVVTVVVTKILDDILVTNDSPMTSMSKTRRHIDCSYLFFQKLAQKKVVFLSCIQEDFLSSKFRKYVSTYVQT